MIWGFYDLVGFSWNHPLAGCCCIRFLYIFNLLQARNSLHWVSRRLSLSFSRITCPFHLKRKSSNPSLPGLITIFLRVKSKWESFSFDLRCVVNCVVFIGILSNLVFVTHSTLNHCTPICYFLQIGQLLQYVRLPLLDQEYLVSNVEESALVKSNSFCKDILIEAMKYHLLR